jgi:spore coat protein U-like protein
MLATSAVPAHAATATATLSVQVTITASCTIAASTMNFGSVSGTTLLLSVVTGTASVSVTCSSGTPYSIGMDNGLNASGAQRRLASSGNFLAYGLFTDVTRLNALTIATDALTCNLLGSCILGTGNGTAQSSTVYGAIAVVAAAPAAGTYTDTVTMTVTY